MSRHVRVSGQVIGTAGAGLVGATWAANAEVARIGRRGEQRSAEHLNKLAAAIGGPTILHDLTIPIPGVEANIDHVIVSGRQVLLLDTKMWKPGFYWTVAGHTRRGLARFTHADSKTMQMAREAIERHLARSSQVKAVVPTPRVLVWPSSSSGQSPSLLLVRTPGAIVQGAERFFTRARRSRFRPADPSVVHVLAALIKTAPSLATPRDPAGLTDFDFS